MLEIEQKYLVRDLVRLSETLLENGWICQQTMIQSDEYLRHPSRDFAQTDEAIRIRREDESWMVTYKGPRKGNGVKVRKEIELPIGKTEDTGTRWLELFQSLGFSSVALVQKHRESWRHPDKQDVVVVIDHVEAVGCYAEVECIAQPNQEELAKQTVTQVAESLGLTHAVASSYLELLLDKA